MKCVYLHIFVVLFRYDCGIIVLQMMDLWDVRRNLMAIPCLITLVSCS